MTRAGWLIVLIALVVGGAAINTGSNLLYLGWGGVMAAIVISGVLSELTLRAVRATLQRVPELRVGVRSSWGLVVENGSARWPVWAVELGLRSASSALRSDAAFVAHAHPRAASHAALELSPTARGEIDLEALEVRTRFPFGFFEKYLTQDLDRAVVVYPARVTTRAHAARLLARLGERPAGRAGAGDELFSLRSYRAGDDPRQIAWRRSVKTGRLVVREPEARASRDVTIVLSISGSSKQAAEATIAFAGSLAEDLIGAGHAVGLDGAGEVVDPAPGPQQRQRVLYRLALCGPDAAFTASPRRGHDARIGVVARGAPVPPGVDEVLRV